MSISSGDSQMWLPVWKLSSLFSLAGRSPRVGFGHVCLTEGVCDDLTAHQIQSLKVITEEGPMKKEWCYVCDLELYADINGLQPDSRGRHRCRVCREADLCQGGKPITQRQLSLALRRLLDAMDVNP